MCVGSPSSALYSFFNTSPFLLLNDWMANQMKENDCDEAEGKLNTYVFLDM